MNALSDQELLRLLQDGNSRDRGFQLLVHQYRSRLYPLALRMVNDRDAAEDVLQDSFVKIWHNLPHFRGTSALFSWMYRIVHNQCLDHLRRTNRRAHAGTEQLAGDVAELHDRSAHLSPEQIAGLLQNAMMRLPEKQRAVFTMRYFDELSYAEMSRITGTSIGALKSSYHIAVKKIELWLQTDRTDRGF
jgi:RNA polymerase sigma-70 factor (ECF subfamily)